jgi:CRISPR-associated endoribonuclease Cas6
MLSNITEYTMNIKFAKDVYKADHHFYLGKMISKMIYHENSSIKKDHYKHNFKPYIFGNLGKTKDKFYKKNKNYQFIFRTLSKEIDENLLQEYKDEFGEIKVIKKETINLENVNIPFIITENPVILVKRDKTYFNQEKDDIKEAIRLINKNTAKKMNYFLNKNIDVDNFDFIDTIRVYKRYPVVMKYKNNVKFIGSNFLIIPKEDELSQQAVKLLYATGIGNKNATVGGGFFKVA